MNCHQDGTQSGTDQKSHKQTRSKLLPDYPQSNGNDNVEEDTGNDPPMAFGSTDENSIEDAKLFHHQDTNDDRGNIQNSLRNSLVSPATSHMLNSGYSSLCGDSNAHQESNTVDKSVLDSLDFIRQALSLDKGNPTSDTPVVDNCALSNSGPPSHLGLSDEQKNLRTVDEPLYMLHGSREEQDSNDESSRTYDSSDGNLILDDNLDDRLDTNDDSERILQSPTSSDRGSFQYSRRSSSSASSDRGSAQYSRRQSLVSPATSLVLNSGYSSLRGSQEEFNTVDGSALESLDDVREALDLDIVESVKNEDPSMRTTVENNEREGSHHPFNSFFSFFQSQEAEDKRNDEGMRVCTSQDKAPKEDGCSSPQTFDLPADDSENDKNSDGEEPNKTCGSIQSFFHLQDMEDREKRKKTTDTSRDGDLDKSSNQCESESKTQMHHHDENSGCFHHRDDDKLSSSSPVQNQRKDPFQVCDFGW